MIALPGGATATSLASEVDSQDEGVSTQPDAADDRVESGSEIETALPIEVDPLPDPEQDVSTGLPDGGEPPAAVPLELGAPQDDGAESVPVPVEAPALPQPPVSAPSPPETAVPEPAGKGSAPHVLVVGDPRARRHAPHLRLHASDRRQDTGAASPDRSPLELAAQPPPTAAQPPPTAARRPAVATDPPRTGADSGAAGTAGRARFHVVQPGESLWSIAADMLGPVASAEAIARRAHRLWALNKTAIGTGDPDVLPAGVTLRLR